MEGEWRAFQGEGMAEANSQKVEENGEFRKLPLAWYDWTAACVVGDKEVCGQIIKGLLHHCRKLTLSCRTWEAINALT